MKQRKGFTVSVLDVGVRTSGKGRRKKLAPELRIDQPGKFPSGRDGAGVVRGMGKSSGGHTVADRKSTRPRVIRDIGNS